jgi:hypothetical protein
MLIVKRSGASVAIFWWTGKGYLTAVIVLAVFSAFGIALPIGSPFLRETPVFWGTAGVVAAVIVWLVGRRVNSKVITSIRSIHFRHKLIYRARHKFMSLPLEIWAVPLIVGGFIAIVYGLA